MTQRYAIENTPFRVDDSERARLQALSRRLKRDLGFLPVEAQGREATAVGVVGSLSLGPATSIEVRPKLETEADWLTAVVELMERRIGLGAESRVSPTSPRHLRDVLADLFAVRLSQALAHDGPIAVLERRDETRTMLRGRLHVGRWVRHAATTPQRFPVSFDALTTDNAYSRALSFVARQLASSCSDRRVRATLLRSARLLRPGAPEVAALDPGIHRRSLPPQYGAYRPAWALAVAILSGRTLVGSKGRRYGFSVVVPTWPLLETLLRRTLRASAEIATSEGEVLSALPKGRVDFLLPRDPPELDARQVEPDGRLVQASGSVRATFEAKYKNHHDPGWPSREDVFQAACAAAACRSRLAVLVYPGRFTDKIWAVRNMPSGPLLLAAIGLDLFSYRRQDDHSRGQRILKLIREMEARLATAGVSS